MDCLNSKLQFRVFDNEDGIPSLIYLAREAHTERQIGNIPFGTTKVESIALRALNDPNRRGVFLATKDDTPLGMLYCSTGEYHIETDVLLTSIHNMNVRRDLRKNCLGGPAGHRPFSRAIGRRNNRRRFSRTDASKSANRMWSHRERGRASAQGWKNRSSYGADSNMISANSNYQNPSWDRDQTTTMMQSLGRSS